MLLRRIEPSDVEPLLMMLAASGQFDDDGIAHVNDTLNAYFSGATSDIWFCAYDQGLAGVAYCSPEVMTHNVWNLLMLWINPSYQQQGVGTALLHQVENELKANHARLLLVETSSLTEFAAARSFYTKQGFNNEARICHYYDTNEDKLIFTKQLS